MRRSGSIVSGGQENKQTGRIYRIARFATIGTPVSTR
jgi:hypothetical protein